MTSHDTSSRHPVDQYLPEPNPSIRGVRVGVPENFYYDRLDPDVEAAVRAMARTAASLGAGVERVRVPDIAALNAVGRVTLLSEASALMERHLVRREDFGADVLALTGASAALHVSDVPFHGPIAGVRVGRINGEFVANPTLAQRAECDLDVVMAASRDAIVMVEGGAKEVSEQVMVDALLFGQAAVKELLDAQEALHAAAGGKAKRKFDAPKSDAELKAKVKALSWDKVKQAYAKDMPRLLRQLGFTPAKALRWASATPANTS